MVLRLKNEDTDRQLFEQIATRLGFYGQGMGKDKLLDVGTDYSTEKMSDNDIELLLKISERLYIEIETSEHCEECYEGLFDGYYYVDGEHYCSTHCIEKNYTDLEWNKRIATDPDNHFYKAII